MAVTLFPGHLREKVHSSWLLSNGGTRWYFPLRQCSSWIGGVWFSNGPFTSSQWQATVFLRASVVPWYSPLGGGSLVSTQGGWMGFTQTTPCVVLVKGTACEAVSHYGTMGRGVGFLMDPLISWRAKQNILWKQTMICLAPWTHVIMPPQRLDP